MNSVASLLTLSFADVSEGLQSPNFRDNFNGYTHDSPGNLEKILNDQKTP